ncbi:MAG: hypothetical protein ACK40G_17540 [Cytophagaceae bacterium]
MPIKSLGASLLTFLLVSGSYLSFSQGCSDAGFCTMGAMKPNQHVAHHYDIRVKSLDISQYIGATRFNDLILSYIADFTVGINKTTAVQVKLPYTFVSGPLGNTQGFGDISLALSHALITKERYAFSLTAGAKFPTNNANLKSDNRPLPMYYQTSLGTYDIIFGGSLLTKKWLFAFGYQQALNRNGNRFTWGAWNTSEFNSTARLYPVANQLERGKDIMIRIERNFRFSRFNLYTGLLPIYRITRDEITSPQTKQRVEVRGSEGLALTLINGMGFRLTAKSALNLLTGIQLRQRDTNPDGLGREYVINLNYQYRF